MPATAGKLSNGPGFSNQDRKKMVALWGGLRLWLR